MKFSVLNGELPGAPFEPAAPAGDAQALLREKSYAELCKMGLALTWPVALIGLAIVLVLLLRH